jgi:hypothetical protein
VIISRRLKWAAHVARTGDRNGAYKVLVRKSEGRGSRRRRKDNIKMDLREIEWGGGGAKTEWIRLSKGKGGCFEFGYEPKGSKKCGKFI